MLVPCPFCGVGCKLEARTGRPVGPVCGKGLEAFRYYSKRLTRPLLREGDVYHEISFDEAVEIAAEWISKSTRPYFVGSAEDTNESAWVLQKLARYLGTNDVDHCGRVCHASSVDAYKLIFGTPVTPFKLDDPVEEVLVVGSDVSVTYPVFWAKIKKEAKRIIVVDAWKSYTMLQASERLLVPPGPGFLAFAETVYRLSRDEKVPEWVEEWIDVKEVIEIWKSLERPTLVHGMGVTQSGYGFHAVSRLVLAVLRKGGTVATLRGKVNVQGAGDMGLTPLPPAPPEELERAWGFELPRKKGVDLVKGLMEGRDLYLIHCQNVVASLPNAFRVAWNLERSRMIQVTPKLTETSIFADLIVPSSPVIWTTGTVTRGDGKVYAIENGRNEAFEFYVALAEKLGLRIDDDIKSITVEAFSLVDHYKDIDVDELYKGKDQYVRKPKGWTDMELPEVKVLEYHYEDGYWFYTARDPALWTTKGGSERMVKEATEEAFYVGEDLGCKRVEVCSEKTGICIEGKVKVSDRVPKGVVLAFFNHLGLRVNALIPEEPREPSGTPLYKAAKVKVKCIK